LRHFRGFAFRGAKDDGPDGEELMHCRSELPAWVALLLLAALGLPLFICMPLWADATLYDLAARNLLQGGVAYRDIFDTNLPGMVWLHAGIRALFGWSSEALRGVDFLVFCSVAGLLAAWLGQFRISRVARIWIVFALVTYYFSLSEWSHCQRDTWMLLPALGALHLRRRQLADLADRDMLPRRLAGRGIAEGILWGIAFWIKPFVALSALATWLAGMLLVRQKASARALTVDAASVLAGGLLAGAAGTIWLWRSGAWPYFWDVLLHWDRDYYGHGPSLLGRTRLLYRALKPWGWLHLLALPLAVRTLRRARIDFPEPLAVAQVLLAVFYLGWLVQAAYLQKPYDYVLASIVPIAVCLLAGQPWRLSRPALGWVAMAAFATAVAVYHPLVWPERLALWSRCWREGSTPELRDGLKLATAPDTPVWGDLARVAEELRRLGVGDYEVTCFHNSPHALYLDLGVRPSTRFLHFGTLLHYFPGRREEIRQVLAASRQRYVVSDLRHAGLTEPELAAPLISLQAADGHSPASIPIYFPERLREVFPWSEPVIFRTPRYLIHEVRGPVGSLVPPRNNP
jgi:hypothetical protein